MLAELIRNLRRPITVRADMHTDVKVDLPTQPYVDFHDVIASAAMAALIQSRSLRPGALQRELDEVAQDSYRMADAMWRASGHSA